jgi:cAMP phosphodiesterase
MRFSLPSTFDSQGHATSEQRLTCFLIDECVAVDAGSIALALTNDQREKVRDIIVTHPHMDHIASLPIFIDDLFETLRSPVRVHATPEVIELLERDIFNWNVYPRFSELKNEHSPVMQYVPIPAGEEFQIAHLTVTAVPVNHITNRRTGCFGRASLLSVLILRRLTNSGFLSCAPITLY